MSGTLAIVLTYNSPADLEKCVAAIGAQTLPPSALLVVDNASSPPASVPSVVSGIPVFLVREAQNAGPAGGHATGLQWFAQSDHDSAWVLDDDMIPEPDCLAELHEVVFAGDQAPGKCLAFPAIVETGNVDPVWYPSWCGVLIPAEAVATGGVPRSDFFWWAEDTEYLQWRLPRNGFPGRNVRAAKMSHLRTRASAGRPAWKVYYETRNSVYYRLHIQGINRRSCTRLAKTASRLLMQILFREPDKLSKIRLFARGLVDGVRGRLGITVPVP